MLLAAGADYTAKRPSSRSTIVNFLENNIYYLPEGEIDYRQKVIEFLREKGVEVHPWMPEDEEYRYENGKAQLYIKEENRKWVKFEESSRYTPNDFDPDKQERLE